MATMGKVLFALLAVGALILWLQATTPLPHIGLPHTLENAVQNVATKPVLSAGAANATFVDLSGIMLLDSTGGVPVPYIEYEGARHEVLTKQLVYPGTRPCAVYAGDLPCVAVNDAAAYPQIPTGTAVRVQGQQIADRILVHQIELIAPSGAS